MDSNQPQTCRKCGILPEDILMLACSHDLCLDCAADRLIVELKKNRNANVIVCEQCRQRTPLDSESVEVLKEMKRQPEPRRAPYVEPNRLGSEPRIEATSKLEPVERDNKFSYSKTSALGIDRGIDRTADRNYPEKSTTQRYNPRQAPIARASSYDLLFQNIPSSRSCGQHTDQQILYFCFDCKCQCICPECVIHGKHKDHDVKTIRKSQPIIKAELDDYAKKLDYSIETLLVRKNEVEKQMRALGEQNSISKKQIQQAFEDLRARISQQEKEVLARADQQFSESLGELEKISGGILKKIDEIKSYNLTISQAFRRDEIVFLNFYARKWRQLQQDSQQPNIVVPSVNVPSNQAILSQILDANDAVGLVGSASPGTRKNQ